MARRFWAVGSLCALYLGDGWTDDITDDDADAAPTQLPLIEVRTQRESSASASAIKRLKLELVDSVTAPEAAKLPDYNLSEALSRITGVQVLRDIGEGSGMYLRGLSQVETTLNGRETFSAGPGRTQDFLDIPTDLISRVDVYKTASASHIEGGLGGGIDIRTRRPLELDPGRIAVSLRGIAGSYVKRTQPQASILLSDRWTSDNGQNAGALLNVSYQRRAWREDEKAIGNPMPITNSGTTVFAPNGWSDTVTVGNRERIGVNSTFQWQPSKRTEFYAEINHAELKTNQDGYQFFVPNPYGVGLSSAAFTNVSVAGGDAQSITWLNPSIASWGSARDTVNRTSQIAVGGAWREDRFNLKSDLSYTKSHDLLSYSVITVEGTAASATQDASRNFSVVNPQFTGAGMVWVQRPFDGASRAWQVDAEYLPSSSIVESVGAGIRLAHRNASDAPGQVILRPASTVPLSSASSLLIYSPYNGYLVGSPDQARNFSSVYSMLGNSAVIPTENPLGTWNIYERTKAAYLMAKFRSEQASTDGNCGIRMVSTDDGLSGNQNVSGTIVPLSREHRYADVLPSANIRRQIGNGLFIRGALSRTLSRPNFDVISPSITLNTGQHIGSAGNPDLAPVRSSNVDFSIERYQGESLLGQVTFFLKMVRGFVSTISAPETYGGTVYQVSRPQNSGNGQISGMELAYQRKLEEFSGWMGGVSLYGNYTYLESKTPSTLLGQNVALEGLSRNSVNLVGSYERGRISTRLAYSWRSKYLSGIGNYVGVGALPIFTKAYGWLDASMTIQLDAKTSISFEGLNLLKTRRESYYGDVSRPRSQWTNDLQLATTLTFRF